MEKYNLIKPIQKNLHENETFSVDIENILYPTVTLKCKRDGINNVLFMEAATTMYLIMTSRQGYISLLSGSYLEQSIGISYQLPVSGMGQKTKKSRHCSMLNDAVVMPDANTIMYALSDRSLQIYDTTCTLRSEALQEHRHLWSIEIVKSNGIHTQYVQFLSQKRLHEEKITQLYYYHEEQTIISSSIDTRKSIVLWRISEKLPFATFSLDEGVRCFAFETKNHQLVSGSDDGKVRLWNTLVPLKSSTCLFGHESGIIDVVFLSCNHLISLCTSAEIRLWNTHYLHCVQKVTLRQSFTSTIAQRMLFWEKKSKLLISLGSTIAVVPVLGCDGDNKTLSSGSSNEQSTKGTHSKESESDTNISSLPSPIDLYLEISPINTYNIDKTFKIKSAIEALMERNANFEECVTNDISIGMNARYEQYRRKILSRSQCLTQCTPHLALNICFPSPITKTSMM